MQELIGPEFPPISGKKAKQLVILLHGLGANGLDLFSLTHYFTQVLPDAHFISPNAPFKHPMVPMGYQWFDIESWDEDYVYNGIKIAAPILENFIATNLEKLSLDYKDLLLIGFSQGAMMSLHVAPRLAKSIAGVIGFSGALVKPTALVKEVRSKCPILLVHGDQDQVINYIELEKATDVFKELNFAVTTCTELGVAHTIGQTGIEDANRFMKNIFK